MRAKPVAATSSVRPCRWIAVWTGVRTFVMAMVELELCPGPTALLVGPTTLLEDCGGVTTEELDSGGLTAEELDAGPDCAAARFGMLPETRRPFKILSDWLK